MNDAAAAQDKAKAGDYRRSSSLRVLFPIFGQA